MSPGKRTTRHTSDILTSAAMGPEELGVLRATPDRPSRGRSSALAIKSRALSASNAIPRRRGFRQELGSAGGFHCVRCTARA